MRTFFTFFSLFIIASSVFAQNFDAGFIGGFTTSQISGDGLAGFDKGGARIGAYISYPINKKLNYQIEMQYLQKGSREPAKKNSVSNYTMNLHYLELPFTLNYELKNGLILESGVGAGVLFSYSEEDAFGPLGGIAPNTLGLDFICGFQYQFLNNLSINLRYGNSILPIRKEYSVTELERNKDWYSSLVSFALLYQISK